MEKIWFIHIQKTAGSSLIEYLQKYKNICHLHRTQDFFSDIDQIQKADIIHGHFSFYQPDVLQQPVKKITFLRNPIERTISQFWHHKSFYKNSNSTNTYDVLAKSHFNQSNSFEELAVHFNNPQSGIPYIDYDNLMVRQLSGVMMTCRFGKLNKALLQCAKANLNKLWYLGFQETFNQDVVNLLSMICNVSEMASNKLISHCGYREKSTIKYAMTSNDLRIIENLNELDLELYEYAKKLKK